MVMPGDNVAVEIELITPIAMEKEVRFTAFQVLVFGKTRKVHQSEQEKNAGKREKDL